jgi:deoxyribodipyrimidine photo-lyase
LEEKKEAYDEFYIWEPYMEQRISTLTRSSWMGRCVLYWMQSSQRIVANPAFDYAQDQANQLHLPLRVVFVLSNPLLFAGLRQSWFIVQGLRECEKKLEQQNIPIDVLVGDSLYGLQEYCTQAAPSLVVCDQARLATERTWRSAVGACIECPLIEIESERIVPVRIVYSRQAWSAAVLRPSLRRLLPAWIELPVQGRSVFQDASSLKLIGKALRPAQIDTVGELITLLPKIDLSCKTIIGTIGGSNEAYNKLGYFIEYGLPNYAERNNPALDFQSGLSPYLHTGQISSKQILHEVLSDQELDRIRSGRSSLFTKALPEPGLDSFLEELLVRRELAANYAHYCQDCTVFSAIPNWAQKTLSDHKADQRPYMYSLETLERAETHDEYWNACQRELLEYGRIHGYLRMYWGKKILEWSTDPEQAFNTLIYLNDRWALDGRDPNGYTGIAWCFGLHDRPWAERAVFGKVRYMNAQGLDRKFDMQAYMSRIIDPQVNKQ